MLLNINLWKRTKVRDDTVPFGSSFCNLVLNYILHKMDLKYHSYGSFMLLKYCKVFLVCKASPQQGPTLLYILPRLAWWLSIQYTRTLYQLYAVYCNNVKRYHGLWFQSLLPAAIRQDSACIGLLAWKHLYALSILPFKNHFFVFTTLEILLLGLVLTNDSLQATPFYYLKDNCLNWTTWSTIFYTVGVQCTAICA